MIVRRPPDNAADATPSFSSTFMGQQEREKREALEIKIDRVSGTAGPRKN
jgi:hypothetical protein